jgi:stress-induced morphogen
MNKSLSEHLTSANQQRIISAILDDEIRNEMFAINHCHTYVRRKQ